MYKLSKFTKYISKTIVSTKKNAKKYPQHITNEHSRLLTHNNIVERLDVSLNTVTSFKNYIERRRPDIRKPS